MTRKKGPKTPKFSHHNVRAWRVHRHMTLEELGHEIGRSHATVQRIESRLVGLTQDTLDELARALQTSRGALLDRKPTPDD